MNNSSYVFLILRSPRFGVSRRGSPRFVRLVPTSLFSSDLFQSTFLVILICSDCSDLLRILLICSDVFPEQIRETPSCRPLLQVPDQFFRGFLRSQSFGFGRYVSVVLGGTRRGSQSRKDVFLPSIRNGQSTVGGPKWTKMDLVRPKWTILVHLVSRMQNPVRNKVIVTKMVVWTILGHFGSVHFPTVLRPLPILSGFSKDPS